MPDHEQILSDDSLERVLEIDKRYRDSIDVGGIKSEIDFNAMIKEIREVAPSLANSYEDTISRERARARFGTGSSAYLKTQVFQPLLDKYINTEISKTS